MVRWATLILFLGCLGALLLAQTPKEPAATEPAATEKSQAKDSAAAAPAQPSKASPASSGASSPANAQYPLDAFKNFSAVMIGSIVGDETESHIYRLGHQIGRAHV